MRSQVRGDLTGIRLCHPCRYSGGWAGKVGPSGNGPSRVVMRNARLTRSGEDALLTSPGETSTGRDRIAQQRPTVARRAAERA